jgi:hypothetical protein
MALRVTILAFRAYLLSVEIAAVEVVQTAGLVLELQMFLCKCAPVELVQELPVGDLPARQTGTSKCAFQ